MGLLGVNVGKVKPLTVKMETVTLLVKVDRIWHGLCIKCMKLIVMYFLLTDFLFLGDHLNLGFSCVQVNTAMFYN
jgi:hypothetical protein